jgi:hypothetical protein
MCKLICRLSGHGSLAISSPQQFLNGPEPFLCGGPREPHLYRACVLDTAVPTQFDLREELSRPSDICDSPRTLVPEMAL